MIFEDFSQFILVENVFEEVVLQSVMKDITMGEWGLLLYVPCINPPWLTFAITELTSALFLLNDVPNNLGKPIARPMSVTLCTYPQIKGDVCTFIFMVSFQIQHAGVQSRKNINCTTVQILTDSSLSAAVKEVALQRRHNLFRDSIVLKGSDLNLVPETPAVDWGERYGGQEEGREAVKRRRQVVSMIQLEGSPVLYGSCLDVPGVERISEEEEEEEEEEGEGKGGWNKQRQSPSPNVDMPTSPNRVDEIADVETPTSPNCVNEITDVETPTSPNHVNEIGNVETATSPNRVNEIGNVETPTSPYCVNESRNVETPTSPNHVNEIGNVDTPTSPYSVNESPNVDTPNIQDMLNKMSSVDKPTPPESVNEMRNVHTPTILERLNKMRNVHMPTILDDEMSEICKEDLPPSPDNVCEIRDLINPKVELIVPAHLEDSTPLNNGNLSHDKPEDAAASPSETGSTCHPDDSGFQSLTNEATDEEEAQPIAEALKAGCTVADPDRVVVTMEPHDSETGEDNSGKFSDQEPDLVFTI